MAWWNSRKKEVRSIENPTVPISDANIMQYLGIIGGVSASGINVSIDNALGVPAIWAAVNFLSGTIASLPLNLYRRIDGKKEKVSGGLATILHDAATEETTSFDWRKYTFEQVLTSGRGLTFIERNTMGRVINLWPLQPDKTKVKRRSGRKFYEYSDGGRTVTYSANEIIDVTFSLEQDMLCARSPIFYNKDTVGLMISSTKYGSKFFTNGGVPPFVMTGNFQTGAAMRRSSEDLESTIKKAAQENKIALSLPTGHEIKTIGVDPEKSQLEALKRFCIEETARIYSLPPVFLQDLTHGTFSNTEQQDLHFVKHTITRWIQQFEQELNLKLFGRQNTSQFVKFNLDGLLRGDFSTRMTGYSTAIQNAILMPNEVRDLEDRAAADNGDDLLIQGATVPLGSQPTKQEAPQDAPASE